MNVKRARANKKIRVFIVDDEPMVRRGLRLLLGMEPDLKVCGDAAEEQAALDQIQELHPDLAIIDLSLKQGSGLNLIEALRRASPEIRILVHSMHDTVRYVATSLLAGAHGYVTKGEGAQHLFEAVRRVAGGESYLSEKLGANFPTLPAKAQARIRLHST